MISVIIPCFNEINFLRACLISFLWQTNAPEFEIILVDNNSRTENPEKIYQEFWGRLPIYLLKQPQLTHSFSLCRARNLGLKLAKYPWILALDSDILLPPHYFKNLENTLSTNSQAIITAERKFIAADHLNHLTQNQPEWLQQQTLIASISNYGLIEDRRLHALHNLAANPQPWAYMHGCNTIYPKKAALAAQGYDEAYDGHWGYEDVDFAYRLITQQNLKPMYDPQLYCYHLEPINSGTAQRYNKKTNPNWKRICDKIPGFAEHKHKEYRDISAQIILS